MSEVTLRLPSDDDWLAALIAAGDHCKAADLAERMRPGDTVVAALAAGLRACGDKRKRGRPELPPLNLRHRHALLLARMDYNAAMIAHDLIDGRKVPRVKLDYMLQTLEGKTTDSPDDDLREYLLPVAREHLADIGVAHVVQPDRAGQIAEIIGKRAGLDPTHVQRRDKLRR